jgi:FkbM family methyltransferase
MFNSQFREDEWIVNNLLLPDKGVVIDVGADQPQYGSNSYYFEKELGWECVCVDADARTIEKLATQRANVVNAIVSDHHGVETFLQTNEPGISHVSDSGNIQVETRTLNSILEQFSIQEITILDIDVEGHELYVCRGLDWDKYKPYIVIIEYISPAGGNIQTQLLEFFKSIGGYKLVHTTQANLILVREGL